VGKTKKQLEEDVKEAKKRINKLKRENIGLQAELLEMRAIETWRRLNSARGY